MNKFAQQKLDLNSSTHHRLHEKSNEQSSCGRRCIALNDFLISSPQISCVLLGEIVSEHLDYNRICSRRVLHQLSEEYKAERMGAALKCFMFHHADIGMDRYNRFYAKKKLLWSIQTGFVKHKEKYGELYKINNVEYFFVISFYYIPTSILIQLLQTETCLITMNGRFLIILPTVQALHLVIFTFSLW